MKDNRTLEILRKIAAFRKLIFSERDIELECNINKTQRGVLMYIAFNGPVPMNDVSEKFALAKGAFTQVADSLEQLSYIERKRCDKDRRIIYLETTNKGKEIAYKIHQATEDRIDSLVSVLETEEKERFSECLEELAGYIDKIRREKDC